MKTTGNSMNIRACIGSAGVGFSFCCRNIEMPMNKGQAPIAAMLVPAARKVGTSQGIRPNN